MKRSAILILSLLLVLATLLVSCGQYTPAGGNNQNNGQSGDKDPDGSTDATGEDLLQSRFPITDSSIFPLPTRRYTPSGTTDFHSTRRK